MPKPTRKQSTLQKIAKRGFAFSGTTREHRASYGLPLKNKYIEYRHGFVITTDILKALILTLGKKRTTNQARVAFETALGFAFGYSNKRININKGNLEVSFDKAPIIRYTYAIESDQEGEARLISRGVREQIPYDEPLHSSTPFKDFVITPELIQDGFEAWKKRRIPNTLSDSLDFNLFLYPYLYRRFLVHIIREYKQKISKKR